MADDPLRDDWVADVLEGWDGVKEAGSGTALLWNEASVPWVKRRIPVDLSWEVRGFADDRTYRVTTITDLLDGTSIIGTYLVPGLYLSILLHELRRRSVDEPEVLLSVEVA